MFCPYCGKELANNTKFCIYCGKPVSNDTSQESMHNMYEVSSVDTGIQDTQVQDVGSKVENQNVCASIPIKKKLAFSKIVVGFVATAVCVALGVGLRFYHDYQLKVKMAEVYKERFGIEVDPNDITLYDSLQDAMADDSWQGGNSLAPSAQPSSELPNNNTNDFPPTLPPIDPDDPNAGLYSRYFGLYVNKEGYALEVGMGSDMYSSYYARIYQTLSDARNHADPLLEVSGGVEEIGSQGMGIAFRDVQGEIYLFREDDLDENNLTFDLSLSDSYYGGINVSGYFQSTYYMIERGIDIRG